MADIETRPVTSVAAWRKSRFCNGASACVEAAWIKALSCNNGSCLEASLCPCGDGEHVLVRDSKLGDDSPIIRFTVGEWWSYIAAVRSGHAYNGPVIGAGTYNENDTWRVWHRDEPGTVLTFDREEIRAFRDGLMAGDFDPPRLASGVVASDGDGPGSPPATPLARFGAESAPG